MSKIVGFNGTGYGVWLKTQIEGVMKDRRKGDMHALENWMTNVCKRNTVIFSGCHIPV